MVKAWLRALCCWCVVFPVSANYLEHPEVAGFIREMVAEHEFDQASLEQLFAQAEKKQSILDAIARPAEKRLEWKGYRKIFLTEDRIAKGRAFVKEHAETLARAERELGVPPHIIAAIIGVETRYGRHKGSYRVIDALSTLAFDYPPRSKFFRKELAQALLLAREQGFEPLALKGSYAGAMGYGQFIPSSYRHYAIDFDGDKVADILDNPVDAIGSVANYFKQHKWRSGEAVAMPVSVQGKKYEGVLHDSLKLKHRVADLRAAGVTVPKGVADDKQAKLLALQGAEGLETWLALHNFYVITRYNHSHLYAMAVHQLSQEIASAP
ncbi:MAG: lytic murein transglycosylase B [Oleiphilaceae bacterium]|nr:lytic murein transglycosylase B [Oleiphilaceae bacterium]